MTGDTHRLLPVLLDMSGRQAVVLGGGVQSARAVRDLLASGARVTVIAGGPDEREIAAQATEGLNLETRGYVRGDLLGASVAACFFEDEELCNAVVAEASAVGCMVYVAGAPSLSSFTMVGLAPDKGES